MAFYSVDPKPHNTLGSLYTQPNNPIRSLPSIACQKAIKSLITNKFTDQDYYKQEEYVKKIVPQANKRYQEVNEFMKKA